MNYGRYKYEQEQRRKESRKKATNVVVKEMKFRPKIDEHDFQFKKRNVERFLLEGNKVKSTVIFRGREAVHSEIGRRILVRLAGELTDVAQVESSPRQEGMTMVQILSPRKDVLEKRAKEAAKEAKAARKAEGAAAKAKQADAAEAVPAGEGEEP
jgi:translation initiation factor IF-3